MDKENTIREVKKWYSNRFVLFEIVKCIQHRELCFISDKTVRHEGHNFRYGNAQTVEYLLKYLEWAGVYRNMINVYNSVAIYDYIPPFTFNARKRTKSDDYKEYQSNFLSHITNYDLFIDFDGGKNDKFYKDAKDFKDILDSYELPYYVLNSSSKGFHFIIDGKYLPKDDIKKTVADIKKIVENIKVIYDFETLDTSIHDIKRVRKVPYSYVCSDGTIALPLNDKQFNDFKVDIVKMENVLKGIRIFKRGLLTRNLDIPEDKLKENVKSFMSEYI